MNSVNFILSEQVLRKNVYLNETEDFKSKNFLNKLKQVNLQNNEKKNKETEKKKLKELSQEFESIFIHQMIKTMRATVGKSNLYHGGMAENIYQDMLDQEYAKSMSQQKNFGIAEIVYAQLSKYL